MNERIKENITRKLDALPDDIGRQLLDYIEFLDSRHNRSTRERTTLERIAEGLEGTLGVGGLSGAAVKGTSQVLDTASNVVRGVAAAGRAVVEEIQKADRAVAEEDGKGVAEQQDDVDESSEAETEPKDSS